MKMEQMTNFRTINVEKPHISSENRTQRLSKGISGTRLPATLTFSKTRQRGHSLHTQSHKVAASLLKWPRPGCAYRLRLPNCTLLLDASPTSLMSNTEYIIPCFNKHVHQALDESVEGSTGLRNN